MARAVKVTVSADLGRWVAGLDRMPREVADQGRRVWHAATDTMFDRSQQFVHVLTGDLKSSGSVKTVTDGQALVGTIEYDSDHAIYEERRGGSHAFLARAYEATEDSFRDALPGVWDAVVRSWR